MVVAYDEEFNNLAPARKKTIIHPIKDIPFL